MPANKVWRWNPVAFLGISQLREIFMWEIHAMNGVQSSLDQENKSTYVHTFATAETLQSTLPIVEHNQCKQSEANGSI